MNENMLLLLTWIVIGLTVLGMAHTISDYNTNLNALNNCPLAKKFTEVKHE
jgi:hypothetical protein